MINGLQSKLPPCYSDVPVVSNGRSNDDSEIGVSSEVMEVRQSRPREAAPPRPRGGQGARSAREERQRNCTAVCDSPCTYAGTELRSCTSLRFSRTTACWHEDPSDSHSHQSLQWGHIADATRLFFNGSSQSENEAHLSPFNSPPVPAIDKDLRYKRDAVRQLRLSFPLTCTFLEPDDVKVVSNVPIGSGGFADIWEGTIDGRKVCQKSYRCYEYCDIERIFQCWKRAFLSTHRNGSHSISEIFRRGVGMYPALSSEHRPVCRDQPHPEPPFLSRPRQRRAPRSQGIPSQQTPRPIG